MNLHDLTKPFPAKDIEWRVQSCGEKQGRIWAKVLAYVTNRAIMERLDSVCGPENWRNEFDPWTIGEHAAVLCGISIKIGDEWITKWDGAENTEFEPVKGGLSSAMKRAAVQWGIGRYLYNLDTGWAQVVDKGEHFAKTPEGKGFYWNPPPLPAWALPADSPPPPFDSIEANGYSKSERAQIRQDNPAPPPTEHASKSQLEAIADLGKQLHFTGKNWIAEMIKYGVKRLSHLTDEQASLMIADLTRRAVAARLVEFKFNLDDVRKELKDLKADTPEDLEHSDALKVLDLLNDFASRQESAA